MFSFKQVVQYNLFGSNDLEGNSSCEFEDFPEEVFERFCRIYKLWYKKIVKLGLWEL
ncbi:MULTISPECIES: hypothetical protein [unclassified Wolbachia]|uniref:hypothetical protein n=1 Tax=unclassified Wolbachia TaxID=2640676 RepID=UPI0022325885|nr:MULTISPECIES: hypothetical protein [unclassified Wolbachia]